MCDIIFERQVNQGDLILLIHKDHPTKSGFWRKIKDNSLRDVYYILEKPIHKEYNIDDEELRQTNKKDRLFIIKANTISYEQKRGDLEKYNIMANIKGTDAVNLVIDDYNINKIDVDSHNVIYSEDFEKFKSMYNNEKSVLKMVAENCI